ncbi:phytochrome [Klebsormidium nitens]|uniref:Phytochrome n=1 Tax=Klebsormidium nitens TaxID=105231 RepID=A0A1Y1HJN4_KLENI|nr:phytochrome [Klebsormidium nitens]|eukprot:GAQ77752.1 phytochrome [Klebsormidium nitens]
MSTSGATRSGSHVSGASSGSSKSKHGIRAAQTSADARLNAAFEASNGSGSFDYTQTVDASKTNSESLPISQVTAYLQRMQRGGYVQSFGCMIVVEEESFRVLALSENSFEILELSPQAVPNIDGEQALGIGTDARSLFTPSGAAALEKAAGSADLAMVNPIFVTTKSGQKPFYAIMHRIEVGIAIDFEPLRPTDANVSAAGALQSHKLAAKAISRLQALPSGDINLLCDTVVEEVRELTGYDRVMAYKFHEDEHGEVIAEIRRSDLDPFLGLHYPATDIPQASRFLFMKNRVRMIANCHSEQSKVVQDSKLQQPISLAGSQIRGVHGCHREYMANMGSIASLVMAVIINDPDDAGTVTGTSSASTASAGPNKGRKLWGLVVCHHTTPRMVPFPLRSACEFLMQVFGLQLNMEVELAAQLREKHILRTQTLLCDMLLRDAPVGIVTQTPSIMDLVKCDGAALYYQGRFWLLGTTPTEPQIKDIADWLLENHKDSTGLSTDSLVDAGYPQAAELGEAVCGLAAARITAKDFLFWFRSNTAKEIRWAGAKHNPDERDDGRRMHPRSSFQAFLHVVKTRSLPWEDAEMDAIHSLQLILRGSFQDVESQNDKSLIHARLSDLRIQGMDELSTVANEMVRLIETATAPILAVDANGQVNGWNAKVAELTGLKVEDAMGRSLSKELIVPEFQETVERLLYLALNGEEEQNVEIRLKTWPDETDMDPTSRRGESVILVVNACSSRDVNENVVGVCFVGQDITSHKMVQDKYTRMMGDYQAIVHNPHALIPPIFGTDEFGTTTEWNPAMQKLTGYPRDEVVGKMLVGEVFGLSMMLCRLQDQDALTKFMIVLNGAMDGQSTDKFPFAFLDKFGRLQEVLLTVNKRVAADGAITGVFCFIHQASRDLQDALAVQAAAQKVAEAKAKELAYIRQEIKNPLDGIMFTRSFIEHTDLTEDQKQLVETSATCEKQLRKILDDMDLNSIEEGYLELDCAEFTMASVLNAVVSQGMITSSKKGLQLFCDTPPEFKTLSVFGDSSRVQQVLADFLQNAIQFTPQNGWVEIKATPVRTKHMGGIQTVQMEFKVSHSGEGLPEDLHRQMFDRADAQSKTQEGLGLSMCRKLVKVMGGDVAYVNQPGKPYFRVDIELPLAQREDAASVK